MSVVVEPVHMGPAVVEGVDQLMGHHPVHVGLLVDVVLAQNNLRGGEEAMTRWKGETMRYAASSASYLRGGCIEAAADRPVAVLTGEMSVFKHFAVHKKTSLIL